MTTRGESYRCFALLVSGPVFKRSELVYELRAEQVLVLIRYESLSGRSSPPELAPL